MEINERIQMILKGFAIIGLIGIILFIFIDTKIEENLAFRIMC